MTRQEANDLFGWLKDSYPRNYADMDARRAATTVDNLADVFGQYPYVEVIKEYKRFYRSQKNEPHPSEILAGLRREVRTGTREPDADPYEVLKANPKYYEIAQAYGERATRRAAKLCTQTASIRELLWRLEDDMPCRED